MDNIKYWRSYSEFFNLVKMSVKINDVPRFKDSPIFPVLKIPPYSPF